jgi:hypothetical protein
LEIFVKKVAQKDDLCGGINKAKIIMTFFLGAWRNGRRYGLKNLSTKAEMLCVNGVKFGEGFHLLTPS